MTAEERSSMTYEDKLKQLFYSQKQTLIKFLEHGAISRAQYEKSLHDLSEIMGLDMECLDVVTEDGRPTGEVVSRDEAHKNGILHRTAHVWVIRPKDGGCDILLQKRSEEKESFPGMFDTSSAGHIPAGDEPKASAIRELAEELGIFAAPEELRYAGTFRIRYEKEFHGRMFQDNEVTWVYVYDAPVEIGNLTLQQSEVSEVRWFDLDAVWDEIHKSRDRFCVPAGGLRVLREYLNGTAGE